MMTGETGGKACRTYRRIEQAAERFLSSIHAIRSGVGRNLPATSPWPAEDGDIENTPDCC